MNLWRYQYVLNRRRIAVVECYEHVVLSTQLCLSIMLPLSMEASAHLENNSESIVRCSIAERTLWQLAILEFFPVRRDARADILRVLCFVRESASEVHVYIHVGEQK
jgi:hypothetical protein